MARTKVVTEQEVVNEIVNEKETETTDTVVTEQEKPKKKEKVFSDDEIVKIKNINFANKTLIGINGKISFDSDGISEVKGNEAKRLISIGFSVAK